MMSDDENGSTRRLALATKGGGHSLFVREQGLADAPAILFLHGFPTSSLDWTHILPLLGEYRAIAPDLLGFGRSDKPRIRYSYALQADLIKALLEQLGIDRVRVVAHDYAVTLAQELLTREAKGAIPFRIDRVVYVNGGVYARLHRQRLIQRILRTPMLGPIVARRMTSASLRNALNAMAGERDAWSEADAQAHWREIAHADGLARLPQLLHYIGDRRRHGSTWEAAMEAAANRSAFVWGPADPVSGAHMLAEVRKRMPDAEIHELDGLGHYPHWEQPVRCAAAIGQALGRVIDP
ncbi:alpha/beta fold hydrolase [Rhizobium halophilum]|uniref:alpha/beta fold hydrolase n=1 Tax=Rhizobium halophilum TaxID=2846852 RepID=UPI001EFC646F|nr:alpha/beta hydrolase [Rhizobium halophilum]MCF6370476.1 alpha/beta hydrolase [Rhizobium halophilum]